MAAKDRKHANKRMGRKACAIAIRLCSKVAGWRHCTTVMRQDGSNERRRQGEAAMMRNHDEAQQ